MGDKNAKKSTALKNTILIAGCMLMATCYMAVLLFVVNNTNIQAWFKNTKPVISEDTLADNSSDLIIEGDFSDNLSEEIEKQIIQDIKDGIDSIESKNNYNARLNKESENKKENSNISDNIESDSETKTVKTADTVQQAEQVKTVVSDVTEVVKAAMPSVVAITNQYTTYDYWSQEMIDEKANGSGIIVAQNEAELLIVTNYHVIEAASNLYVKFIDEKEVIAYVKGTDPDSDLAVISVFTDDIADETLSSIAIAVLGDSQNLQVGEPAIAIGNSLGYGQSVTTGVISALDREVYLQEDENSGVNSEYLIQTDAAINPGNSGGALLNVRGEVIGINSSKIADYVIEGMGYAIPITTAKPIIEELSLKETRKKVSEEERAFLGISGSDVSIEAMESYGIPEGVYVVSVLEDTAAEKYGLLKGDIITAIDGEKVTQMTRIQSMLEFYSAETSVEITIMRQEQGEYKKHKFNVVLGHK